MNCKECDLKETCKVLNTDNPDECCRIEFESAMKSVDFKELQIAFNLLLADHINISRSKYCHWNCPKGNSCDCCKIRDKRHVEYWTNKAKEKLKS